MVLREGWYACRDLLHRQRFHALCLVRRQGAVVAGGGAVPPEGPWIVHHPPVRLLRLALRRERHTFPASLHHGLIRH